MSNIKWNNVGYIFAGISVTIFTYLLIGDVFLDLHPSRWWYLIGWVFLALEFVSFGIFLRKKRNR